MLRALAHGQSEELIEKVLDWAREDPEAFVRAARSYVEEHGPREAAAASSGTWQNIIGNQVETPQSLTEAQSLADLVAAVEGAADGEEVRAVGSGWSFSDITLATGHMITTEGLDAVLDLETSVLKSGAPAPIFRFEGGITIKALNQALADEGLALINMGGDDGQSFVGAMSTSTHGSGVTLGPFPSMVLSLDLVAGDGTVHRVEPADGITDPAAFAAAHPDVTLHQDDNWFRTVTCSMGCTGLIASVYLSVMNAYNLTETRTASTWNTVKAQLAELDPDGIPAVVKAHRHYEVDVNPYPESDGDHFCIVVTRDITTLPPHSGGGHRDYVSAFFSAIPGMEDILVAFLNLFPCLIPALTTQALESLEDENYVDQSFKVLNLGPPNDLSAYGIELSVPMEAIVPTVEQIMGVAAAARAESPAAWQTAPIALRFVAPATAYLSPQVGRPTCMIECDTLNGTDNGWSLLSRYERATIDTQGARVHWGLDDDVLTATDVRAMYPDLDAWCAVFSALNHQGHFDSEFTRRVGLSDAAPAPVAAVEVEEDAPSPRP